MAQFSILSHSTSKPHLSINEFPPPNPSFPPSPYPPAEFPLLTHSRRSTAVRTRLSRLCKEGRLELARLLFDSLPCPVPTLLWNALLIGYVCNSMPDDALRLYNLMNSSSSSSSSTAIVSDHYTYSSTLKACADSCHLRLGQSIHCHILRRSRAPPANRVLNNSLLNMYASALDTRCTVASDVVQKLFDRMPKRNVVSWNTLIAWYVRSRRPAVALEQFLRMIEAGVRPSTVSFVNVFPAAVSVGSMEGSVCWANFLYGMLIKLGSEYVADMFVVSSAIFMYSELWDILQGRSSTAPLIRTLKCGIP